MPLSCCPYCKQSFARSRYRPDQVVCSRPDCQRQRRAAYHRRKLQEDRSYCEQCHDSQQHWREQHPEYMRTYREKNKSAKGPAHSRDPLDLPELLKFVKNNVAIDLKAYPATVLLIGPEGVKNSVATAKLILVQSFPTE
jgi:hypothetical protein